MKHELKFIYFILLAVVLQNCSEDENADLTKELVQFSFEVNATDASNGRTNGSNLPNGTKVLISIESSSGSSVLSFQQLEILRVGNNLLTLPLELTPGSYKITDFLIVNEDDEILYGTPKKGSPLAGLVTKPLATSFSVARNQINNIQMEVVDVYQNAPEDFGYVSFHINILNPLQIAVFRPNENGLQLTSAKAYILQDDDTVQFFNLYARTNLVGFRQSKDETYTLAIVKSGYTMYTREFNYNDLSAELNGLPLKIILEPAVTMIVDLFDSPTYYFDMDGVAGSTIAVNWGDGTSNNYTLGPNEGTMEHTYPSSRNYFISVTGDLENVSTFLSFYGNGSLDEINLERLPELKNMRHGLARSPRYVNLTQNTKLEEVFMPAALNTKIIDLPLENNISQVSVSGPNALTTASLSSIIDDVHHAAVVDNRREGRFEFYAIWYIPSDEMVVTPTPEALAKLIELRDVYGWTIAPNP